MLTFMLHGDVILFNESSSMIPSFPDSRCYKTGAADDYRNKIVVVLLMGCFLDTSHQIIRERYQQTCNHAMLILPYHHCLS